MGVTYGYCRALVFYHIRDGNHGNVNIDSLEVIYAISWPKAIHEGNGTIQLYITRSADAEQRQAIVSIFIGKVKGDGLFTLFAPTLDYVLEPQFVDINARLDGKKVVFLCLVSLKFNLRILLILLQEMFRKSRYNYQKNSYGRLLTPPRRKQ